MQRNKMIAKLTDATKIWDIIVIGGGATGLGIAVDAASRGYTTLLLEQHDFAAGTSSRSTKLIHGGLRYLQQGNISLVLEALQERGMLMQNAPHLVRNQTFLVPYYEWWEAPFYGVGLKVYDLLAGKWGLCASKRLSREATLVQIPTLAPDGLRGGIVYCDGQFDDARLAITLARTAADLGGCVLNYFKVTDLLKDDDIVTGVNAQDQLGDQCYAIRSKVVINATGVLVDHLRRVDAPDSHPVIRPSQGTHLVLDRSFQPGDTAILVPHTDDGRVLFAVPWHDRLIVGTTDTPVDQPELAPRPLEDEVVFLLEHIARYLTQKPRREDVLSVFAGVRPLIGEKQNEGETLALARDHQVLISGSGLVSVAGGKWTTYRKMAEDALDQAVVIGDLASRPCRTRKLKLHGWQPIAAQDKTLTVYGSDAPALKALLQDAAIPNKPIHARLPYTMAEVVWSLRHEMACTLEDVLARRTRALILDAQAALEAAAPVAAVAAAELGQSKAWQRKQVEDFTQLARSYLPA